MLLIGSKALKYYGDQYICPDVKRTWDTDFIATYDEFQSFKNSLPGQKKIIPLNKGKSIALMVKNSTPYEFEIAWENSTGESLINLVKENDLSKLVDVKNDIWAVNPDVVFTLKKSHRFLRNSPHFLKTMKDYKWLRDNCNCKVPEVLDGDNFYKQRISDTYWYKHPNTKLGKEDFFNDDIYTWDHDSIHKSVAHLESGPAYLLYKENKAEVNCSKELFDKLPEQIKIYSALEESYVLAIERSIVPFGNWSNKKAFEFALQKLASSISSGWYRNWIWENFNLIKSQYNDNYVSKFHEGVKLGIVHPHIKK